MELTDELIVQASHGEQTNVALTNMNLQKISCSKALANLVRLDLSNNGIQSIKALSKCRSLKWLSMASNNLGSLDGIEALQSLMVLNCGCNHLSSIREVEGLFNLRALIVNDNKITALCKFQKLTVLTTLVLSKNPISGLTAALESVRTLNKLSLSNCKLQELGSIEHLIELKELRLAHNSLKCLSGELAKNSRLQILDLGSNLFNDLSDIKVVNTLPYLRNLNIQGNPFCIQAGYEVKIQTWLPALRVLDGHSLKDASRRKAVSQQLCGMKQQKAGTGLHTSDKKGKVQNADKVLRKMENEINQTFQGSFHKIKKHQNTKRAPTDQSIEAAGVHSNQTVQEKINKKRKKAERESTDDSAAIVQLHEGEISSGSQEKKTKQKLQQLQEPVHKVRKDTLIVPPDDDDSEPFIELIGYKKDTQVSSKLGSSDFSKEDTGLVSVIRNQSKFPNSKKGNRMSAKSPAFSVHMMDVDIGEGGRSSWN